MILDKLKKLQPREKFALTVALLFVLGLLIDHFVVKKVLRQLSTLEEQIAIEQTRLDLGRGVLQSEEDVRNKFAGVEGVLGKSVPTATLIEQMKGEVDEIARRNGVDILSMEHREPREPSVYYKEYLLDVGSMEGSMTGILAFLADLRAGPGLMRVAKISLSPSRGTTRIKGAMLIGRIALSGGE